MKKLHYWLEQYAQDLKWAFYLVKARRFRRTLPYFARRFYDNAIRPRMTFDFRKGSTGAFSYPEAFYASTADDFERGRKMLEAMLADEAELKRMREGQGV